jgi:nitroreductase
MADSALTTKLRTDYREPAIDCNFEEFAKVVESRRSVRLFTDEKIPDAIVERCLDLTLAAPNSSNLQPWEFYWVKTPENFTKLQEYCLSQNAAKTAATLIVCVARPDRWRLGQKINLDYFATRKDVPPPVYDYYQRLVPFVYGNGPLGIFGPFKTLLMNALGLFKVMPRGPFGRSGNLLWATKTTALACENLMLAFRAAGYDSCPMEGMDEVRIKKLLKLPCCASVAMVISAGKRAPDGIYAPRIRGPKDVFIHKF